VRGWREAGRVEEENQSGEREMGSYYCGTVLVRGEGSSRLGWDATVAPMCEIFERFSDICDIYVIGLGQVSLALHLLGKKERRLGQYEEGLGRDWGGG
jgi:hypothetical protein